ncbi:unnamed protein product [Caenorhabditis brenneri]
MTETPELSIHEKAFAKSDKTDAILVVQGKKFHVNKAVLSYHSDYFNVLFNSDFKEKSMEEIPIEDVNVEDFATVLSLVHKPTIKRSTYSFVIEEYLKVTDRFQLPAAKRHTELLLLTSNCNRNQIIEIADKYKLNEAMSQALSLFQKKEHFDGLARSVPNIEFFNTLSIKTRLQLFYRVLEIDGKIVVPPKPVESPTSICEKTFEKSDKTDAILVVDGKKLHVNKAILSYHSDYFNKLFNSDFKEKSMEEIPIEDVNFVDFATLLSLIHLNPLAPTKENAEKILELADRFTLPCIKYYLEPFIISFKLDEFETIRIGEKYGMKELVSNGVYRLKSDHFTNLTSNPTFQAFSDETKSDMFYKYLRL